MQRSENRNETQPRKTVMTPGILLNAEGSVLIAQGQTRVICAATVEDTVPKWLVGQKRGWVTAEYSMLPRSTVSRMTRERVMSNGRTHEIQRLIGRSLRSVCDLRLLPEKRITLDCDVIQADGGTRTASITGSWVALAIACHKLLCQGKIATFPLRDQVAAISVGICHDAILTDLDYPEDSSAQVDANIVITGQGQLVEVQATAEDRTFTRAELERMLDQAHAALQPIFTLQKQTLATLGIDYSALLP